MIDDPKIPWNPLLRLTVYTSEFDYRKAFDTTTKAWARERLRHNATLGHLEQSAFKVVADINTLRHAYGLPVLLINKACNDLADEQ